MTLSLHDADPSVKELLQRVEETGRYLAARPSPHQVCRYLVLHTRWLEHARGALLATCEEDGRLEIAGSFGYPTAMVEAYRRLDLAEATPLTDAVTRGEPVTLAGVEAFTRSYPVLADQLGDYATTLDTGSLLAVPLIGQSGPVGAFGLTLAAPLDGNPPTGVRALAPLLATFLAHHVARSHMVGTPAALAPFLESPIGLSMDTGLTRRQLQILGMLAQKQTNQQIARELGFSLSTVTQDTTVIYRVLRVSGRREAVAQARALGLIPPATPRGDTHAPD